MTSRSGGPKHLPFDIVDVFADAPFAGNQLAVVHGASGLSDAQLLAIAREFGYSETTFPDNVSDGRYGVRIFTPGGEIPFAGHPTLGTAWVLRDRALLAGDRFTQLCKAGTVAVAFADELVELSVTPGDVAGPLPDSVVASLLADLGLDPSDRAGDGWVAGTGLDFVHLPVGVEALSRARPHAGSLQHLADRVGLTAPLEGVSLYAITGAAPELVVRARVFVPELAKGEDPATGSAAAGLGLALVAAGRLPEGGRYEITQGVELGRASRLFGRVEVAAGSPVSCHVAGRVFPVARGELAVPFPA